MPGSAVTRRKFLSGVVATAATFMIVPRSVLGGQGNIPPGCMTVVAVPDWPMKDGRTCRGPWEAGLERPIRRM